MTIHTWFVVVMIVYSCLFVLVVFGITIVCVGLFIQLRRQNSLGELIVEWAVFNDEAQVQLYLY